MSIILDVDKRKKILNFENGNKLSFWDLVFWQNEHVRLNDDFFDIFDDIVKNKTHELLGVSKNPESFNIVLDDNEEYQKYINFQNTRHKKFGEYDEITLTETGIEMNKFLDEYVFEKKHQEDFFKLIFNLKNEQYEPSFQYLMIKEYLTTLYKTISVGEEKKKKKEKRDINRSLFGIMNLSKDVLKFIYENGENYKDFKDLYFDAQKNNEKILKKLILDKVTKNGISKSNLDSKTCNLDCHSETNKGHWIKIPCQKEENGELFEQNVEIMQSILSSTPSCLASKGEVYLSKGPVYIFVDKNYMPHISVNTDMDNIWEVEGNLPGRCIEEEFVDVALEFFNNNKQVSGAKNLGSYVYDLKTINDITKKAEKGEMTYKEKQELKKLVLRYDDDYIDGRLYYVEQAKKNVPGIIFEKHENEFKTKNG